MSKSVFRSPSPRIISPRITSPRLGSDRALSPRTFYVSYQELDEKKNRFSVMQNDKKIVTEELDVLEKELKDNLEQIEKFNKTVLELRDKKKIMETVLRQHDQDLSELKKIIEKSHSIWIIYVGSEYEIVNGLIGIGGVVMKLIKMLDEKKVRNLIGIGQQLYVWKEQDTWKFAISNLEYSIAFLPKTAVEGVTYSASLLTFDGDLSRTVCIEQDISISRTFVLDVGVCGGCLYIGLAVKSAFPDLYYTYTDSRNGTCSIYHDGLFCGKKCVCKGMANWNGNDMLASPVFSPVRLEFSQRMHTLHFAIADRQLPHCVTGVPMNVFFVISCYGKDNVARAIQVRSLRAVTVCLTDHSLPCEKHVWAG